jgi:hypothetical protein
MTINLKNFSQTKNQSEKPLQFKKEKESEREREQEKIS